jgi:hypothetical protein
MSAVISPCGRYRYRLDRPLSARGPTIAFLLHNPSTADAENEDPTSRRGIGFANRKGMPHIAASRVVCGNRISMKSVASASKPATKPNKHSVQLNPRNHKPMTKSEMYEDLRKAVENTK